MLFTTTQEHEELRRKIREFAEGEIKPQAFLLDRSKKSNQIDLCEKA